MKNRCLTISFIAGITLLILPVIVWAVAIPNPLKADTFEELVNAIIGFITKLAFAVAPIMILIAGFLFVTGGGNPGSLQRAKNIILYTVIGLAVILLAGSLIKIIEDLLSP